MIQFAKQAATRICGKTGLDFEEILCRRPDRFLGGLIFLARSIIRGQGKKLYSNCTQKDF